MPYVIYIMTKTSMKSDSYTLSSYILQNFKAHSCHQHLAGAIANLLQRSLARDHSHASTILGRSSWDTLLKDKHQGCTLVSVFMLAILDASTMYASQMGIISDNPIILRRNQRVPATFPHALSLYQGFKHSESTMSIKSRLFTEA